MINITDEAKIVKKLIIGALICEYAAMELDGTKFELKHRANVVVKASRKVQDWFKHHPICTARHRAIFEKEFLKSEMLLISELLESVYCLNEDDLEVIIEGIKQNTDDKIHQS